jgi:diacylglycerol kinase (ATP)
MHVMVMYSSIHIIFNPNSTGNSKELAYELAHKLKAKIKDCQVECVPTQHAGHAEEMARSLATAEPQPLIISSSGDGGYNEVINGVLSSGNTSAICAVLPAGNANDHGRTMHSKDVYELILDRKPKRIDALRVHVTNREGEDFVRYAHSYVGLGLTPVIAVELNRHSLNAFKELKIVLQRFYKYRPFKIRHNGKVIRLNSLIFANINQMAKVLTLAEENHPDDGKFEIVQFRAGKKRKLLGRLVKAAMSNLPTPKQAATYEFKTIKKMPMQLDGEVINLPPMCTVTITSAHKALKTLV